MIMVEFTSVEDIIQTILAILVIVIFLGAVYALIRSILLFIFSHGDTENKKKARNWIRFMIIGLILTVILLFLFQYILKYIGVESYEQFSASKIFEKVQSIINSVIGMGKGISDKGNTNYNINTDTKGSFDVSNYEL